MSEEEHFWSFGFGSNMDITFVEKTKEVKVLDHIPAILKGYRLVFNYPGYPLVEPAFGNVKEEEGAETHGVAFCMTRESMERMIKVEPEEYKVRHVALEAYDGRRLNGFIFIANDHSLREFAPSKRYLGIILRGARAAGLRRSYLEDLEAHPTYSPPGWVRQLREERPKRLSDLPEVTVEELARHDGEGASCWISVMGYVVEPVDPGWLKPFRGRDITSSVYLHYNRLLWYQEDKDGGKPPFPLLKDFTEDDLEHLTQFLDSYHAGSSTDGRTNMGKIVGHLKEFREQQESGMTEWRAPQQQKKN